MDTSNPVAGLGNQGEKDFGASLGTTTETPAGGAPNESGITSPDQKVTPTKSLTEVEGGQQQTAPEGQQQTTQTPAAQTTPPPLTPQSIVDSVVQGVLAAQRQTQAPQGQTQQPQGLAQLTQEQFDQKFGVTRAKKELVAAIIGQDPDAAAAALDAYGQSLVRQGLLMGQEIQAAQLAKLRGDYDPHISEWQNYRKAQREAQHKTNFFKAHPDLVGEDALISELTEAFGARVKRNEVQFSDINQVFAAVAESARKILKKAPGQAGGQPAGQVPPAGQPQGRQMSALSSAGRAGTGGSGGAAKSEQDKVLEAWNL